MKKNKIRKNYRLHPIIVEYIEKLANYRNRTNTAIVEQSLCLYFAEYRREHPEVAE
jgi:hypothetical protein